MCVCDALVAQRHIRVATACLTVAVLLFLMPGDCPTLYNIPIQFRRTFYSDIYELLNEEEILHCLIVPYSCTLHFFCFNARFRSFSVENITRRKRENRSGTKP